MRGLAVAAAVLVLVGASPAHAAAPPVTAKIHVHARLDGEVVAEGESVVPPRLVVRGTTAPPATR